MADVIGQRILGNLVYVDRGAHLKRLLDAIGPDVIKYVDDFTGSTPGIDAAFDDDWAITRVEEGGGESTIAKGDGVGGIITITTDANENDGINAQLLGEAFKLGSSTVLYFGIRMKISEATQSDFFAGLCITNTDLLAGVTDRIGFEKLDGATAVKAMLEKDSTETLTASLLTADTSYHILEFCLDADGTVEFFVDGVSAAAPATTNLPNDEELRVSLHFLAGSAAARTMDVDWIRCIQIGGTRAA